jgi:hypothetical protein
MVMPGIKQGVRQTGIHMFSSIKSSNRNDFYKMVFADGRNEAVHGAPFWCACRSGVSHKGSAVETPSYRTALGAAGGATRPHRREE